MSSFRREELEDKITELGLRVPDNRKLRNIDLIKILGNHWLSQHREEATWGRCYVQYCLESPMLISHYKDYKDKYTEEYLPLDSSEWISELKINDHRVILTYSPESGFELFSRRVSVKNYLNGVFTEKVLFIKNGVVRKPQDFINAFNYRFVIDCGAMIETDELIFDGVEYSDKEDFLQAVLGSLAQKSREYQMGGKTLVFHGLDVLYFEENPQSFIEVFPQFEWPLESINEEQAKWVEENFKGFLENSCLNTVSTKGKKSKKVWEKDPGKNIYCYLYNLRNSLKHDIRKRPFYYRRKVRDSIIKFLQKNGLPFESILTEETDKVGFADEMIRSGQEGSIIKNVMAPYFSTENRSHRAMYKVKTNISSMLSNSNISEDFDAYIIGVNPAKSKDLIGKGLFGSLKVAIYLRDEKGDIREHEVANVSGIPWDTRKQLSYVDENGKVQLKDEYIGKVVSINGMSMSCRNLRFNHAILYKNSFMIKAKDAINCVYDESFLRGLITVKGT